MLLKVYMREPAKSPMIGLEICWFATDFEDPSRIDVMVAPDMPTIIFSAKETDAWAWEVYRNSAMLGDGALVSWQSGLKGTD